MPILVIGGAGFIGASLVRKLVAAGRGVVCLDANPDPWFLGEALAQVTLVRGDMAYFDELAAVIAEHRIDQVICVAYMLAGASEAALHAGVRVNVMGLDNVFKAARLAAIKLVLFASSVTYHGTNPSPEVTRITEESPAKPLGAYGWQKQFNEVMAARYAAQFGMTIVAVRPPIVFGPGRRQGHIGQAQLINEPAVGNPVQLAANPDAKAAMVYVDDVAELFFKLAMVPEIKHAAYLTGGYVVSYAELATLVRRFVPAAEITFASPPQRGPDYAYGLSFDYDHSRARAEFGYDLPALADRVRDSINGSRSMHGLPPVS
ncbi:MAG: NAD(P)-dependent oxidoreductase [Proteobacteria bacterium]|nr:NAD(P)-dependent oxidoreductase [Pseudomonadota bacterium]